MRADDPAQRRPVITLAQQRLGWQPMVPLREGLAKTIAWFRSIDMTEYRPPDAELLRHLSSVGVHYLSQNTFGIDFGYAVLETVWTWSVDPRIMGDSNKFFDPSCPP